jgi:hypothetical protein
MPATPKRPQLEALQAEFKPGEHKTRSQGGQKLTYVDISATINRVNEVLGASWSVLPQSATQLMPLEAGFLAKSELFIEADIDGVRKVLYGVGAMQNRDPDMAMKTALAEAIKKAFHQAGVALYLWDAERREAVTRKSELATATLPKKKAAVQAIVKERLGVDKPTAKQVAEVFGVTAADLAEDSTINAILEAEGLL